MKKLSEKDILGQILQDCREGLKNEDMIHELLSRSALAEENPPTKGQKAADILAKFAGSWGFVAIFTAILLIWMGLNVFLVFFAFDPYPFILLNLVLSCLAAIQAPLIMMSQNRAAERDRARAESDYRVGLKSEIILQDLHQKLDSILDILSKQNHNQN